MKKSKFTEAQVVLALNLAEAGVPVEELLRKYGISRATFYGWRKKYGGLEASEMKRLRDLEEENKRLRAIVLSREIARYPLPRSREIPLADGVNACML